MSATILWRPALVFLGFVAIIAVLVIWALGGFDEGSAKKDQKPVATQTTPAKTTPATAKTTPVPAKTTPATAEPAPAKKTPAKTTPSTTTPEATTATPVSTDTTPGNLTAASLKVGDCITDALSTEGDVTTFQGVPCTKRHDGEVYTQIVLEGGKLARYPGAEFVNGKGQRGCRARLKRQLTSKEFKSKRLGFKFVFPTPVSWADGDRKITCVATFKKPRDSALTQR